LNGLRDQSAIVRTRARDRSIEPTRNRSNQTRLDECPSRRTMPRAHSESGSARRVSVVAVINFVSRVQTARWLSIPSVCDRGDHDRPVSSTIRAERLRALFHSLPKGPFHLSFTLLLRCRSWSSLFSLRRWTPARLHSTLKLRDSSPGRRLITVACACDPYPDPSARSA